MAKIVFEDDTQPGRNRAVLVRDSGACVTVDGSEYSADAYDLDAALQNGATIQLACATFGGLFLVLRESPGRG